MKIIAIGDIHGRDSWKAIMNQNEDADKFIFTADYFDTHEKVSAQQQLSNFKDIIATKKQYPQRVILLIGNHDYHYLPSVSEHYSGYQPLHAFDFQEALKKAIKLGLMKMCHTEGNVLFVHAGIKKTWYGNNFVSETFTARNVNDLFKYKPNAFGFTAGRKHDPYGDEICQSPVWVRPDSLRRDKIDGYKKVVGHTTQKKLIVNNDVILIDTLGTSGEYLQIKNGKITAKKIIR